MGSDRKVRENYGNFCMHRGYDLDASTRTVTCRECGRKIDAFDALQSVSRDDRWHEMRREERKKEAQRVAFLKGEERRVKDRLKNANRKDADAAVAEERKKWRGRLARAAARTSDALRASEAAATALKEAMQEAGDGE